MERKLVIDVSRWDGDVDFKAWRDRRGCWAAIPKCGGNDDGRYRDSKFESHYAGAKSAGLHVGTYYYSVSTTVDDAKRDAEHCLSLISGKSFDMPVYIDVEDARQFRLTPKQLTDVIKAFCDAIQAKGYKAGVYTGGSAWMNNMLRSELYKYADWIAAWRRDWPSYCEDGGTIGMWQQGGMDLDGDVIYGDDGRHTDCSWCVVDYPASKKEATVSLRDRVVSQARSQVGTRYYSMNYSAKDGFSGWMGTHYVGQGWGCAQLASMALNTVLGTKYAGSVWNFSGDALGDRDTNQGGGEFEFTDNPLPGDVVVYLSKGHDGTDAEDYGHAAVYVGDGKVVGAWGKGIPGQSGYWAGRGVSEDFVGEQSLGNGWRFVRCKRLDKQSNPEQVPGNMVNDNGVFYRAHVERLGWLPAVRDGQVAGTVGYGLRMEAIKITPPEGVTLDVTVHVENVGDKVYRGVTKGGNSGTGSSANDPIIGTVGRGLRIEGIKVDVTKNDGKCKGKRLRYRCHCQNVGWTGWTDAGQYCGTKSRGLRVEAMQFKFE